MRLAGGFVAAALLCACGPSPEAIERGRVLAAIDAVRDAPAGEVFGRRRLLAALERTSAVAPECALARDTCATAYRLIVEGTELQDSVRAGIAGGEAGPALAARLVEATSKIKRADTVLPDCERAIAELRLPSRR